MSMAEEIIEGEICAGCLMPFTQAHGYPVVCAECSGDGWTQYGLAVFPIDKGDGAQRKMPEWARDMIRREGAK